MSGQTKDGRQAGGAREAVKGSSRFDGLLTACGSSLFRVVTVAQKVTWDTHLHLHHITTTTTPNAPNLITRLLPEQAFASSPRLPTISATRVSAYLHTPIPIGSRGSLRGQPPLPQAAQFLVTIRPGPVKDIDWRPTWLLSLSPPYYCTFTSKQWPQRHSETA